MRLSLFLTTCLLITPGVQAASVSVIGEWFPTVGAGDLAGGAGTDLQTPVESSAYQATITIANTGGASWTLVVSRTMTGLPIGVSVAIRRSGSGSCDYLQGGSDYRTLNEYSEVFFSGIGDCDGIGIQVRFDGISVLQPPGSYNTMIRYTLQ